MTSPGDNARVDAWLNYTVSEVPAEKVADYATKLREFRGHLGYTLSFDPVVVEHLKAYRLNWILVGVIGVTLIGCVYVCWRVFHRPVDPSPLLVDPKYAGLGGWLVFVAFGVIIRPLAHAVYISKLIHTHLDARVWPLPAPGRFISVFGAIVSAEIAANLFLLSLSVVTLITFFKQLRVFLGLFVAYVTLQLLSVFLDAAATHFFLDHPFDLGAGFWQMVVPAMIWVPYMVYSKRVRATFVNGPLRTPSASPAAPGPAVDNAPPPLELGGTSGG